VDAAHYAGLGCSGWAKGVTWLGADLAVAALLEEQISQVFGVPGTTEIPLLAAAHRTRGIDYRLCLHEGVAVGMADGFARASPGQVAAANTHATQGTLNGLGFVRAALRDSVALLLLVGTPAAGYALDEPNHFLHGLADVVGRVTKWTWQVSRADEVGRAIHRASTLARLPPQGPVAVLLPQDVLVDETDAEVMPAVWPMIRTGVVPTPAVVRELVAVLSRAKSPVIIAGTAVTARKAIDTLIAFSERYGLGVVAEAVDRGPMLPAISFPLDHPNYLGAFSVHDHELIERLRASDLVVLLGTRTVYPRVVGQWVRTANIVQIDENPWHIGRHHALTLGVVGDLAATLDAWTSAGERTRSAECVAPQRLHTGSSVDETSVGVLTPRSIARTLRESLPDDTIVVDDSQSFSGYLKRYVDCIRPGNLYGSLASHLGWGIPAALGVLMARPGERILALVSDASFALGVHGLWNAAHDGLPLSVIVINNQGFLSLRRELLGQGVPSDRFGATKLGTSLDVSLIANGFGLDAQRVTSASALRDAVRHIGEQAVVIDVAVTADLTLWDLGWTIPSDETL
jgi:benzoylformate decarboxylase